jgi:oligoendopeptidase F
MDKVSPSSGTLTSAVETPNQLETYTEHRRCIDVLDSSAEAFRQAMKRNMEAITSSTSEFQHAFLQEAEEEIADTLAERRWMSQWLKHVTGSFFKKRSTDITSKGPHRTHHRVPVVIVIERRLRLE